MKQLYLGNEAVARGLYEAGVRVVSAYPGTPSTEITEAAVKYPEIYCEWAPNEKVATETRLRRLHRRGTLLLRHEARGPQRGRRPPVHHELHRRERRHGAGRGRRPRHALLPERAGFPATTPRAAKVPMVEPADSKECRDFTKLAYELSEEFDTLSSCG